MNEIPAEVFLWMMAVAGGIARVCHDLITGKPFRLLTVIGSAVVAGFSGFMFVLFMRQLGLTSLDSQFLAAGMGGWLGVEAIKYIQTKIEK